MRDAALLVVKSFSGNANLFHMIAGMGIINIKYEIGRAIFRLILLPQKNNDKPQSVMIKAIRLVNSSDPIVPIRCKNKPHTIIKIP